MTNPRIAAAALMHPYVQHSLANMSRTSSGTGSPAGTGIDLSSPRSVDVQRDWIPGVVSQHANSDLTTISHHLGSEERKKRNRTFIDPVTEVPRLEQWFSGNSHPPHSMIVRFTQELNSMPYRQKFPKLEAKNVQFWFKNRRAKCKRMKLSL